MHTGGDDGRPATKEPKNLGVTSIRCTAGRRRMHNWWVDISRAWGRTRRHPRLVAAVAVAVAVGTTSVGFTATGTLSSSATRQPGDVHVASATAMSPASPSSPRSGGGAAASDPTSSGIIACPMMPAVPDVTGANTGSASLGSATHLFTRTTTDGVTIRAYRLSSTESCTCGPIPASSPPSGSSSGSTSSGTQGQGADSSVTPEVSVELSDDTAIGQGILVDAPGTETTTATGTSAATEPLAATSGAFGVVEGTPVWWIAVSVGSEVANVQVTFADGSTDLMSPVGGVAVLASQIDPSVASTGDGPYEVRATLQLLDDSGAVIDTVTFPEPSPTPTPVPEPTPAPGTPPEPVPGSTSSTSSTSVPTLISPPATSGGMIACPEMQSPATSAG